MTKAEIGNAKRTRAIIDKYGVHAKKGFGQNFLTDLNVLTGIVDAAQIQPTDNVIEIGPGIGALTEQLAKAAGEVVAVEIDADMLKILDEVLSSYDNVQVVNQDILQVDLPALVQQKFTHPERPVKVVANLPYYITSPILMHLLASPVQWATICVMMQKEVAERLTAKVGTKQYGALTLAIEYSMQARLAFGVSRHSFIPAPNVDSAIVVLTPREKALVNVPFDRDKLLKFIKTCFAHRRKTLWNNLKPVVGKDGANKQAVRDLLATLQIDPGQRPETLTLDQYIRLLNGLHAANIL